MRVLTLFILVVSAILCGCAHRSEPRFITGAGDAGQFILQYAIARGGQPISTNGLPTITGTWRFFEDQYGVVVQLSRRDYDVVEAFLRQAFGAPKFGPAETTSGGRLGGYRLTPKGGGIQFGCNPNGTQVIVLRPLTKKEFEDSVIRATRQMGEEDTP